MTKTASKTANNKGAEFVLRFRPGFPSRGQSPTACKLQIEDIAKKIGRDVDGETLAIEAAPGSPCGKIIYYESDSERLDRARKDDADDLISSLQYVRISRVGGDKKPEVVEVRRAFISYDVGEERRRYGVRTEVLSHPIHGHEVVQRALRDLQSWLERAEDITELGGLTATITKAVRRYQAKFDQ